MIEACPSDSSTLRGWNQNQYSWRQNSNAAATGISIQDFGNLSWESICPNFDQLCKNGSYANSTVLSLGNEICQSVAPPAVLMPSIIDSSFWIDRSKARFVARFVKTVKENICEDLEDLAHEQGVRVSQKSVDIILKISQEIAPVLAFSTGVRFAAFVDSKHVLSIVLRSEVSNRRVEIAVDSATLAIVADRIDEVLKFGREQIAPERRVLRELAAWVM